MTKRFLKITLSLLISLLVVPQIVLATKAESATFYSDIDLINLDNGILTNSNLFIYGTSPEDKLVHLHLRNIETNEEHFLWSGYSDHYTQTFTMLIPFSGEGTFDIVMQILGPDGAIFVEKPYGPVTFSQNYGNTPLDVEASYKINTENGQTSVFSLDEIAATGAANVFGPSVNLTFEGITSPSSKIFLLWKGETEDFTSLSVSHLDGTFSVQPLTEVEPGFYTAYLYSQNLENSVISEIFETNFNITSNKEGSSPLSLQTLAMPLAIILLASGGAWAYFSMQEEDIIKENLN